jgi:uncharacterized integral membrane protein (TIGR00698 family)
LQILPSKKDLEVAAPGLVVIVLPVVMASEILYWIETSEVTPVFKVPAPVIPIMIAAVMALVLTNLRTFSARYDAGMQFSTRWLLRIGIVLYGLNFSYSLWFKQGSLYILLIGVITVVVPLIAAYFFGRVLGLDHDSSVLVGVGTGICGISAILATQQATKSDEKSAGMALATILLLGTGVLLVYPPISNLLHLSSTIYGIWTGATTLDLPQLVAAALQGGGGTALEAALWVKSIRIGLLVPAILLLVLTMKTERKKNEQTKMATNSSAYKRIAQNFPLFIIAFFGAILVNTLVVIPSWISSPLGTGKGEFLSLNVANVLLTCAIIGICFRVRKDVVGKAGWKILIAGGAAWAIQSLLVFGLVSVLPLPHL